MGLEFADLVPGSQCLAPGFVSPKNQNKKIKIDALKKRLSEKIKLMH